MMIIQKFFCFKLETAAKNTGLFFVLESLMVCYYIIKKAILHQQELIQSQQGAIEYCQKWKILTCYMPNIQFRMLSYGIGIGLTLILLVLPAILLIIGTKKQNHYFLLPWLILNVLIAIPLLTAVIALLFQNILTINFGIPLAIFIGSTVYFSLHIYMFLAVFSLYYQFKTKKHQNSYTNDVTFVTV